MTTRTTDYSFTASAGTRARYQTRYSSPATAPASKAGAVVKKRKRGIPIRTRAQLGKAGGLLARSKEDKEYT